MWSMSYCLFIHSSPVAPSLSLFLFCELYIKTPLDMDILQISRANIYTSHKPLTSVVFIYLFIIYSCFSVCLFNAGPVISRSSHRLKRETNFHRPSPPFHFHLLLIVRKSQRFHSAPSSTPTDCIPPSVLLLICSSHLLKSHLLPLVSVPHGGDKKKRKQEGDRKGGK